MSRFRFARASATAALIGLALAAAAPAAAAEGDDFYAIGCPFWSNTDAQTAPMQLIGLDEATGAGTAIGAGGGSGAPNCAYQAAVDPTTGTVYATGWRVTGVGTPETALMSIDLTTGASEEVGEFTAFGSPAAIQAIAIGLDGTAYAVNNDRFGTLDLATAEATLSSFTPASLWGLAVDPTTGSLYGMTPGGSVYLIDPSTGSSTLLGTIGFPDAVYSLQIDSDGVFWVELDTDAPPRYSSRIGSFSLSDLGGSGTVIGPVSLQSAQPVVQTLIIVPGSIPPPLAPTSADQCKKGGFANYPALGFKNQGDCVSFVATKGKNTPAGS